MLSDISTRAIRSILRNVMVSIRIFWINRKINDRDISCPYNKTSEELDYSVIGSFAPAEAEGKCVYCNHCKPCPEGLDIGLINKYYDLACMDDSLAIEHYKTLDKKASDCISCGHCDKRCPFGVKQSTRMKIISQYFGE